jgi:hypothetical protein
MAEQQTYRNHIRVFPLHHFFVLPVLLANVINALWRMWLTPTTSTAFAALVAAAILMGAVAARMMALKVQDRIIRLEMRQRLAAVLPAELQTRVDQLTLQQLIALRFASDAELPALVRDVLGGKYTTGRAIKQQVKDWQPDWLRA